MHRLNGDMIYEIMTQESINCRDVINIYCLNKTMFNLFSPTQINNIILNKIAQRWSNQFSTPQIALVTAAREGHLIELKALIHIHVDPTWNECEALLMAVHNEHLKIISYLLDIPQIIETINSNKNIKDQILSKVIINNNVELFELLISKVDCDFTEQIVYYRGKIFPLQLAWKTRSSSQLIELVINNTPYNYDTQEIFLETLFNRIEAEDKKIVNLLLESRDVRNAYYQHTILYPQENYNRLTTLQILVWMGRDNLLNFLKN